MTLQWESHHAFADSYFLVHKPVKFHIMVACYMVCRNDLQILFNSFWVGSQKFFRAKLITTLLAGTERTSEFCVYEGIERVQSDFYARSKVVPTLLLFSWVFTVSIGSLKVADSSMVKIRSIGLKFTFTCCLITLTSSKMWAKTGFSHFRSRLNVCYGWL